MREILQGKIHNATVTQAELSYIGSITIDSLLLEKANFWPGQKVLVVSNTSGNRLETYIIKGAAGSGEICMNGAAAHLIKKGEQVIIIGFQFSKYAKDPTCILVDKDNKFIKYLGENKEDKINSEQSDVS